MTDIKEQFLQLWNNFNKKQKIFLFAGIIAVFTAILGWSYWLGGKSEYVPLYTGLETKDAGEIVNKFKENKISYEITENGATILVPQKEVYQLRMDLASQGLPRGKKGFEIFEENKFGTTEFQNKVNYLQALQGELGRTIEQIKEVESARVHIVMPEDSLYKKNEKPASASVMLQLRQNGELKKEQITGIVNLVSHSVQGLKPENITIIDGFAKVLNLPEELAKQENDKDANNNNVDTSKLSKFYFSLTREIQTEMQENVQTLLDKSLGGKKAVARVTVELNFDRRLIDRQIFEPTTEDKGILRSTQDVSETYQGANSVPPGGPPGTTSNIPGYPTTNQQGQSNYERKESTKNYEITEIKEKIIQQPVSIKRITVAVFIDESLTQAQQDGISRVVASAAGFNETRGDLVSVERVPFSANESTLQNLQEQSAQAVTYLLYALPVIIILLAIAGWLFYSHRKKKALIAEQERIAAEEKAVEEARLVAIASNQEEQKAGVATLQNDDDEDYYDEEDYEQVLDLSNVDRALSPEAKEVAAKKIAIEEWAANQPEEFVAMLRTWLSSEE